MRSVVALVVASGCGRVGFDDLARTSDASAPDMFDQCASERIDFGPWGAPTEVQGVNASQHDDDPAPRFDDLELIWGSNRAGAIGMSDLWRVTRASPGDPWGPVEQLLTISTAGNENTPALSSDGLELFFSSNRAGSMMEDVWTTTRPTLDGPWSTPVRVAELSSSALDRGASLWNNDLGIIFHSDRAGPSEDFYVASRATRTSPWSTPTILTPPSTPGAEVRAWMSPCGLELTFQSSSRGVPHTSFYIMTRPSTSDPFSTETEIVELGSPDFDEDLQIMANRRHAYFSTQREGGAGEIYEARR